MIITNNGTIIRTSDNTPYFINATGYRGSSQGVSMAGTFDKTSVVSHEDKVINLRLTLD